MIRQRIALRDRPLALLVRLLTLLLGCALFWYGLMVVLAAVKVAPHTIEDLSGYRTIYNHAIGVSASNFDTLVRLVAGFGGFFMFLLLIYLATQELPRPYLARGEVRVGDREQGDTIVAPRAIERAAEFSAVEHHGVTASRGRLGDRELDLAITVASTRDLAGTLRDVRERVHATLREHELPDLTVNVTLTGFDPPTKRELQ